MSGIRIAVARADIWLCNYGVYILAGVCALIIGGWMLCRFKH